MKIVLVAETLTTGGAETFVIRLANGLAVRHDVHLLIIYANRIEQGLLAKTSQRVQIHPLKAKTTSYAGKLDSVLRKAGVDVSLHYYLIQQQIIRFLNKVQPDIVHSHLFKADLLISNIKDKVNSRFKHVITVHGDYSAYYYEKTDSRLLNIRKKITTVTNTIDHIVCICKEHSDFFNTTFPNLSPKLSIIYNGYSAWDNTYLKKTKASLGLPNNAFIFGMVSRGVEKKGWRYAIEAFIAAVLPDTVLVLVGEGAYLSTMQDQYQSEKIIFTGNSNNPLEYIQHFDVGLLPTIFPYESLPTVIMEYLYCHKPVIATDVGEIGDMLQTGHNQRAGYLLPFRDEKISVNDFIATMKKIHSDKEVYAQFAMVAKNAFRKFEMNQCTKLYEDLYTAVL